jgi:hypothetical protein
MSATTTPTLLNLPPLPKPRTVNELANTINYTYSEINRAFNIISRAFKFDKTVTTGNTTVTGTQIGGFLITADSLVSTITTTGLSISLNSANATTPYALVVGDVTAGSRALTIGNGVVYGHLVDVAGVTVAQMRRGIGNTHGYLSVTKNDNTTVFVADGNANACTVGGTLAVGTSLTVGDAASTSKALTFGYGTIYGHLVEVAGFAVAQMRRGLFNNHGYLSIVKTDNTLVFVADGNANTCAVGGTLSVTGNVTCSAFLTAPVVIVSPGGYLRFPDAFAAGAPVATGYLYARDNIGNIYKLLCAP